MPDDDEAEQLRMLREAVGGPIELIYMKKCGLTMLVNENARRDNLEVNKSAQAVLQYFRILDVDGDRILGPVVFTGYRMKVLLSRYGVPERPIPHALTHPPAEPLRGASRRPENTRHTPPRAKARKRRSTRGPGR